jgi:hypothetical protein
MLNTKKYLLAAAALGALSACGGDDPANTAPRAADVALDGTKAWLPVHGKFKATDANGNALSIARIVSDGAVVAPQEGRYTLKGGILEVHGLDFTFTPLGSEPTRFTYVVSDGSLEASAMVQIAAAASDPLAEQQWHLRNTGQKAYAMSDSVFATLSTLFQKLFGVPAAQADAIAARRLDSKVLKPGEDMNVMGAYAQGATGQGAVAVVVDSGLEMRHEDLAANMLPNRSLNLVAGAVDPTDPTSLALDGDHGTSVAGLIAAAGWNGLGGRGVAPEAKLIGINYLKEQSARSEMLSHGAPGSGIGVNDPVAVFNRSYGLSLPIAVGYSEADEAMQAYSATTLRGGKGAVNIKASGNSFDGGGRFEASLCADNQATALGLTCINANFEPSQATPYYFAVGAVNSDGRHTSYSTAGANLLVSAPAGEFGDFQPAMVTTDQATCLRGYSSFPAQQSLDAAYFTGAFAGFFPFNNPGHPDNLSCNYTSSFNGTSSAAPNASGVVALILGANPALGYRDVRDILVKSSTQVDPDNAAVSLETGDGSFVAHPGWVRNAAGHAFNNLYGFGRVNAGKAVQMARAATPLPASRMGDWQGTGVYGAQAASLDLAVPDNSRKGAEVTFNVADDIRLEGAQFKFRISNPEFAFGFPTPEGFVQTTAGIDLAIEVISPAGTRSVLLSSKQALVYPALSPDFSDNPGYVLKDAVFLSNAFYGESAKGTWTVRVLDANGSGYASRGGILGVDKYVNNSIDSRIEGIALRVFGH